MNHLNGTAAYHRVTERGYEGEYSEIPENPENTVNTVTLRTLRLCDSVISTEEAVRAALPKWEIRSDDDFRKAVFRLARHLKAVPRLLDKSASDLKSVIRDWYESAKSFLHGRTFTDTYAEFVSAWPAVKHPAGDDPVKLAWEIVQRQPPPREAANYDDKRVGTLIALCRQLQIEHGGGEFYLSGYVAGRLLGISQPTARNWFKMLEADGILEVVDQGGGFKAGHRLARSYRCRSDPRG